MTYVIFGDPCHIVVSNLLNHFQMTFLQQLLCKLEGSVKTKIKHRDPMKRQDSFRRGKKEYVAQVYVNLS